MARYVFNGERMVDVDTGEPMVTGEWKPVVPRVMSDIEGYRSPVDGSWIEGRRARRYDLAKNNAIDAREISTPKKLKNERFIKKRGLEHLSEQ